MGGYKAKLKSKIKSKLKAKFSSSSKLEKPSTPDIKRSDVSRSNEQISKELQSRQGNAAEPTSVTRKVDPEQTLERNPNAHKGSFGNTFFMNGRIQQFKNKQVVDIYSACDVYAYNRVTHEYDILVKDYTFKEQVIAWKKLPRVYKK